MCQNISIIYPFHEIRKGLKLKDFKASAGAKKFHLNHDLSEMILINEKKILVRRQYCNWFIRCKIFKETM